ncbi:MAG: peptide deformylase [bacterium]
MQKKILQKEEKVLHEIAKEVPIEEIQTAKIKKILKEMSEALGSQNDGVAIAAPQIGYSLRIFVVAGKVFTTGFLKQNALQSDEEIDDNMLLEANNEPIKENPPIEKNMVFINPKISRLSRKKEWLPEGCLSVRPLYGKTFRSLKATVTAYDENGNKFTRGASGLLAQIFQHETDHLNGILFIDHAKEIKEEELPHK